ncbi:hypothetical protein CMV_015236 [Castanea mollissima]|uniref:Aminotransferase-like plant mobile domain-containing protein n=1 Tax=Castanea mollissima TaxID=60419 RepID=A0A8J4QWH2_9ROSI|nr:hypothetical protein CMV_015236 [Castanea mollissima]
MMLFFKDSKIGQEPALFICKEKDDKDAKATTLIVYPPIIGIFSERWGHNSYPPNLSKCTNGGFSYSHYWDWLEDVLGQCKHLLDVIHLYNVVFASLFMYDYDENLMKALCECWSPPTNTFHTSVGKFSITLWDLSILGGLPCTSAFYDEVVPNAQKLDGTNDQGRPYLLYSCRYLFMAYHQLQNRLKRQGKDLNSIRPGTFKVASSMANGCSFGLAPPVLASKFGASFAIHYVYAWVGYTSPFSKFSVRKHIQIATDFLWHKISFKKSYDQTFIDNNHLSIQNQGIKGSLVVPVRDAIKISTEEVCNDFDHDWKHLKSPMTDVDVGLLLIMRIFLQIVSLLSRSHLRRIRISRGAMAHVSYVRRKGASMLGDVLLNRLLDLSIDNILPQAKVNEIYSGVESLGVDPQHLRKNIDKYCEGVVDYLKVKASLNKRPSPIILIRCEAEVEFLLSEASHEKASLKTELDIVRLRIADLQIELVQLEQLLSQIELNKMMLCKP